MNYVGIDIAKKTHFASVSSSDGEVLVKPFGFANDADGFSLLLSKLSPFGQAGLTVGLESTSHYGDNLVRFLFSEGYKICVINPIQTASLRKNNIRKTKTDKTDTYLITKALILNNYRYVTGQDIEVQTLKNLCRFRQKLLKYRTKAKIQLVSYVDRLFPELQYFFKSGIHIKTCYALLKEHSAPGEIAAMHLTRLTGLLTKASGGHFKKETAIRLKELAARSVGTGDKTLCIQITHTLSQIELFDTQLNAVEQTIANSMKHINSVIMSAPGIGTLNGAMILGEIGSIHRFSHPCKLLAFAGLDPTVNQSGKFTAKHTKMSKRGSKVLRYALMNAAHNVVRNNATFRAYYDAKISQGRSHYNALGHVAGKLVRVIFKMLKDNVMFDLA